LAIALVWPGRQYLSQFRLGQFQYHLPNSSSQRFAQPIRSKKTFHLAETLYTFPHRRIPPRSDSPHEPDSFLGYRENTPSLFSTTSGPLPGKLPEPKRTFPRQKWDYEELVVRTRLKVSRVSQKGPTG